MKSFMILMVIVAMTGCATKGSVHDLRARVATLEAQQMATDSQVAEQGKAINQARYEAGVALKTAQKAETNAAAAAKSAADAATKADRAFQKTVRK